MQVSGTLHAHPFPESTVLLSLGDFLCETVFPTPTKKHHLHNYSPLITSLLNHLLQVRQRKEWKYVTLWFLWSLKCQSSVIWQAKKHHSDVHNFVNNPWTPPEGLRQVPRPICLMYHQQKFQGTAWAFEVLAKQVCTTNLKKVGHASSKNLHIHS